MFNIWKNRLALIILQLRNKVTKQPIGSPKALEGFPAWESFGSLLTFGGQGRKDTNRR